MKWFHHECTARHDPKLQTLAALHGPAGVGIYWMLLEEIGQHSDTFCLVLARTDEESGNDSESLRRGSSEKYSGNDSSMRDLEKIPHVSPKILARTFVTTPKKLQAVIETCVEVGLFDRRKWFDFNMLYSPSFEQRADDYTRRSQRRTNSVRTLSEQSPDNVRTDSEQTPNIVRTLSEQTSDKVRLEQNRIEKKRTEQTCGQLELSTIHQQTGISEEVLIAKQLTDLITEWNEGERQNFSWMPSHAEVEQIMHFANSEQRALLCREVSSKLGRGVTFSQIFVLAVRHMLEISRKTRIANPVGWLRTCLYTDGLAKSLWLASLPDQQTIP